MQHALTYSLIAHLRDNVTQLNDVVWMYDGVSLTGRAKPFATVEQMPVESANLSKERLYYGETYHFQIGLFASNASERSRLEETMLTALREPNMTLYDTSGTAPSPVGVFYCDVDAVTPMTADDASSDTNKHRLYFDVSVTGDRTNGGELRQ